MNETRVLLVDDEEEFVEILAERLQHRGFRVTTADDGPTGVAAVRDGYFDAVVLDMAMPGMDGVEALAAILELNPDQQVIMLTGRSTPAQAADVIKLGALDLLEKPAELDSIVERIDEAAVRTAELRQERANQKTRDILKKKGW